MLKLYWSCVEAVPKLLWSCFEAVWKLFWSCYEAVCSCMKLLCSHGAAELKLSRSCIHMFWSCIEAVKIVKCCFEHFKHWIYYDGHHKSKLRLSCAEAVPKLFWSCFEAVPKLFWSCFEAVVQLYEAVVQLWCNWDEVVTKLYTSVLKLLWSCKNIKMLFLSILSMDSIKIDRMCHNCSKAALKLSWSWYKMLLSCNN